MDRWGRAIPCIPQIDVHQLRDRRSHAVAGSVAAPEAGATAANPADRRLKSSSQRRRSKARPLQSLCDSPGSGEDASQFVDKRSRCATFRWWAVELRAFLDAWFRPELLIRRSATVPQPSKDGCASSRRPRPFSSLKTAIRRSDTIHKSPRGDAPGQPKSLRNRRFCRVSFTRTLFWSERNDFATKV